MIQLPYSSDGRLADRLAWLVLAVLAIAAALTFGGYGIGADEWNTEYYGRSSLAWYLSRGADTSSFDYHDLHYYGAGVPALIALLERLIPAEPMAVRHGVGMALGLVCLAGTWRLGRRLAGPWGGFAALSILALTPYFWGQMAFLPVDMPFATAMTWALVAVLRYAGELPRPSLRSTLLLGGAAGLAAGVRVGALPILAFEAAGAVVALLWARGWPWRAVLLSLAWQAPLAGILAWIVMLACWPWAMTGPVSNPIDALVHFGKLPIDFEFPFWGELVRTTALPWTYIPGYLLAKLPLFFIAALLLVPVTAFLAMREPARTRERTAFLAIVSCAGLAPILAAIATHATLYDGIRHFLFVLAPLAALAGFAVDRLARSHRIAAIVVPALALVAAVASASVEARLYPYEYIWFNELAGGVAGTVDRFEQEYWASAESDTVKKLRATLRAEGTELQPYRYKLCVWWNDISALVPPNWVKVEGDAPRDFLIATQRFPCAPDDDHAIARVVRDGVPLSWVSDQRKAR